MTVHCARLVQIVGGTRWPAAHDKAEQIKRTLHLLIDYLQGKIDDYANAEEERTMRHMPPMSQTDV